MSTHSIGFYEALTKMIFQLSSNIFKYATLIKYLQICNLSLLLLMCRHKDRLFHYEIFYPFYIMQTCPCNVYPLTPHFYIVKLGFTFEAVLISTHNQCFRAKKENQSRTNGPINGHLTIAQVIPRYNHNNEKQDALLQNFRQISAVAQQ